MLLRRRPPPSSLQEIPADQVNMDPKDKLVTVQHFHRDPIGAHSLPFLFRIKSVRRARTRSYRAPAYADRAHLLNVAWAPDPPQGETVGALRDRLRRVLAVNEKDFAKYKLARLVRGDKAEYYADSAWLFFFSAVVLGPHGGAGTQHSRPALTPLSVHWPIPWMPLDAAVVLDGEWGDKDVLGLDHVDRAARSGRYGQFERAVVIKN